MKKTSLYLHEADRARLRRLAEREGSSQTEIVRTAIATHEAQCMPERGCRAVAPLVGGTFTLLPSDA